MRVSAPICGLAFLLAAGISTCKVGISATPAWDLSPWFTASALTPPDPALPSLCGAELPPDTLAAERAACRFVADAPASTTLGATSRFVQSHPIWHVVILMQENRSFDHLLGRLHGAGQADTEAIPADYANRHASAPYAPVTPFHAATTCLGADPEHQWSAVHIGLDRRESPTPHYAMDGFVASAESSTWPDTDGAFVMSYYDATDLPFFYWLANTFALRDRHFAPLATGTFPNRDFLLLGTNAGVEDTWNIYPPLGIPSIFQRLHAKQVDGHSLTWKIYSDGDPLSGTLGLTSASAGVYSEAEFIADLDSGHLPNVAFVDGRDLAVDANPETDLHPPSDLQVGEAWLRNIYQRAIRSPQWMRTALIWTTDEAGGFADHVAPPLTACAPSDSEADQRYRQPGPRVPFVLVSPWARRHFVSHVVSDHVAITRFLETIFDLPAMTARDANSDALLELFDFSCGRDLAIEPAPEAGHGGCPTGPRS